MGVGLPFLPEGHGENWDVSLGSVRRRAREEPRQPGLCWDDRSRAFRGGWARYPGVGVGVSVSDAGSSASNAEPGFRRGRPAPLFGLGRGLPWFASPHPTLANSPSQVAPPQRPSALSGTPPPPRGWGDRAGPAGWIRGDPRRADSRKQ